MNTKFAKCLLIDPVHFMRHENIKSYMAEVLAVNAGTTSFIEEYQKRKLKLLVENAEPSQGTHYKKVSTYKNQLLKCDAIDVFNDIPILTKEMVRTNFVMKPNSIRAWNLDLRSTSGSTGKPLKFYKDRYATGYMDAVLYCAYMWHGIEIGDPQARFWGMPLGTRGKLIACLKDRLKNRIRFSAFNLSDAAKFNFYQRMMRFRPTYFYGYPSLIAEFCKYLRLNCLDTTSLHLKAVVGTGEYVVPEDRTLIESTIGTRFANEYGCTEVGLIAFECNYGQMHIMASNVYVEVIKDGNRVYDEEGDIVITELNSKYKPFIRYAIGDRGILYSNKCGCNCNLPIIKVSAGRKDDYVITPEGNKIYDAIFAYTFKKGIDHFKVVQRDLRRLDIYVVVNDDYSEGVEYNYKNLLAEKLSKEMDINFIRVTAIEKKPSGKHLYFERLF